jgi:hypothetical protein
LGSQRGEQLQDQGRLANARIATDQHQGAGDNPAAKHSIHLADVGEQAGVFLGNRRRQRLGGCACAVKARGERLVMFGQTVPGSAVWTATKPFAALKTALAAEKERLFFF